MTKDALSTEIARLIRQEIGVGVLTWHGLGGAVVTRLEDLGVIFVSGEPEMDILEQSPLVRLEVEEKIVDTPLPSTLLPPGLIGRVAQQVLQQAADADIEDEYEPRVLDDSCRPLLENLCREMNQLGLESAVLEISGGGDSGQVESVQFFQQGSESDAPEHLTEQADRLYWEIVEHSDHSGWYNDEGGYGEMIIRSNGEVEWDHHNYHQESDRYGYSYSLREDQAHEHG